jgi:hypothetical protein
MSEKELPEDSDYEVVEFDEEWEWDEEESED